MENTFERWVVSGLAPGASTARVGELCNFQWSGSQLEVHSRGTKIGYVPSTIAPRLYPAQRAWTIESVTRKQWQRSWRRGSYMEIVVSDPEWVQAQIRQVQALIAVVTSPRSLRAIADNHEELIRMHPELTQAINGRHAELAQAEDHTEVLTSIREARSVEELGGVVRSLTQAQRGNRQVSAAIAVRAARLRRDEDRGLPSRANTPWMRVDFESVEARVIAELERHQRYAMDGRALAAVLGRDSRVTTERRSVDGRWVREEELAGRARTAEANNTPTEPQWWALEEMRRAREAGVAPTGKVEEPKKVDVAPPVRRVRL